MEKTRDQILDEVRTATMRLTLELIDGAEKATAIQELPILPVMASTAGLETLGASRHLHEMAFKLREDLGG